MTYMRAINVTSRCGMRFRDERLEGTGLTGVQAHYILNICRNPGITQDDLTRAIYANKSNVARQLTQLEQNGFVVRESSPTDRRSLLVYPTEKAKAVLPQVREVLKEWNALLTADFTEEEKETLLLLLERVMQRATEYIDEMRKG